MPTHPELRRIREELLALYQQWQQLTVAEGQAIHLWDWPSVEQLQTAKQELQPTIAATIETLRAECARHGVAAAALTEEFRGIVTQLLDQETVNHHALAATRQQTQADLQRLDSSHRNLRQLQQAYVRNSEDGWQSYS